MPEKKKIILISDAMTSTSGVATQSRYLSVGLAQTGKYKICQLGAAIKHENYDIQQLHPDIVVKPIDGFGDKNLYRHLLITEKPDAVIIFNDPRFFTELFSVEDEFHQVCPILYWHLWDQCEFPPLYNKNVYDACDAYLCINRPTYEFLKPLYTDKVHWAPHALPKEIFHPIKESEMIAHRKQTIPGREDHFVVTWCNRNAHRKRPGDVMWAFRIFLDKLKQEKGHEKATLIMHTDPNDIEGPNLLHILDLLKLNANVVFSRARLDFPSMNMLFGISDTVLNISSAEGFGLGTLEAMYAGKPIIAIKTGGLERQVVDYRDGSENGIALPVDCKKLVGSQPTPFICEDIVKVETVADALYKMYDMGPEKRKQLGFKAMKYAHEEFDLDHLIKTWDSVLEDTMLNWKSNRPRWTKKVIK
jgi:glycosyltransferase involved in cell wall biosynthesis